MGLGLEFGGSRVRLGFWVWGSRVLNDLEFAAAGVSSQLQASDLVFGAQQGVKGGGVWGWASNRPKFPRTLWKNI